MNANAFRPTTKEELRAIIEQELKRQGADADLNNIDVSCVTDMSFLFYGLDVRNIKIDKWDTSNVTNMSSMFYRTYHFNGDISRWDTSKVTDMHLMFAYSASFNGDPLKLWGAKKLAKVLLKD